MPLPSANPSARPIWGIAQKRPRRPAGLCSTASEYGTGPVRRPGQNPAGCAAPTATAAPTLGFCAAVGNPQINAVAMPMNISMVSARLRLRPIRSPMWPNTIPPTGRMTNPTANVANASSVPTSELSPGKKTLLNTRPAAVALQEDSVPLPRWCPPGSPRRRPAGAGVAGQRLVDRVGDRVEARAGRGRRQGSRHGLSGPRRPRTASPIPGGTGGWAGSG